MAVPAAACRPPLSPPCGGWTPAAVCSVPASAATALLCLLRAVSPPPPLTSRSARWGRQPTAGAGALRAQIRRPRPPGAAPAPAMRTPPSPPTPRAPALAPTARQDLMQRPTARARCAAAGRNCCTSAYALPGARLLGTACQQQQQLPSCRPAAADPAPHCGPLPWSRHAPLPPAVHQGGRELCEAVPRRLHLQVLQLWLLPRRRRRHLRRLVRGAARAAGSQGAGRQMWRSWGHRCRPSPVRMSAAPAA